MMVHIIMCTYSYSRGGNFCGAYFSLISVIKQFVDKYNTIQRKTTPTSVINSSHSLARGLCCSRALSCCERLPAASYSSLQF